MYITRLKRGQAIKIASDVLIKNVGVTGVRIVVPPGYVVQKGHNSDWPSEKIVEKIIVQGKVELSYSNCLFYAKASRAVLEISTKQEYPNESL